MKHAIPAIRAAALLLVLALLIQPLAGLASMVEAQPGAPGSAQEVGANEEVLERSSARLYVEGVSRFVNITLRLAARYNITLNESLEARINTTMTLLAQAKANLTINVTLAVQLATSASLEFAPVAKHVWASLPDDVRKELEARRMLFEIKTREKVLAKLEERVRAIENLTGVDMNTILEAINETLERLETARSLVEEGNLTGARIILKKATVELFHEARKAAHESYRAVSASVSVGILTVKLVDHVERLARLVNDTITLIETGEGNESNITQRIEGLVNMNRVLLSRAETLIERVPNATLNGTIYIALTIIIEGLNGSQLFLECALNASVQGNLSWTLSNLTMALETLNTTLASIAELDLPGQIRIMVRESVRELHKIRELQLRVESGYYALLSRLLDRKMVELQDIVEKYQNGEIPAWKLRAKLIAERTRLIILKERLPATAPDWLIQKIDNLIAWINENMP